MGPMNGLNALSRQNRTNGATVSVPRNVAKIIQDHVTFELECIDRMYLNVYVPALQCESGVVGFFRRHRGYPFASSALMDPMTKSFVTATERFWRAASLAAASAPTSASR